MATIPAATPAAARGAQLEALRRATLGEYEILVELGRGGMATVYLAHDLALDRKVAVKVLAPALLMMGEGMVERFKREARTAAALSHPHIIPIYAVKESDQVLCFVMKYVQGRALDSVISDVGPLPIPMVQTILAHVGDALGYAHRHGVIHRDIKSANIMLDEDGWAVVTDFGIAKVVEAQGLTMTGVTVGTPTYMSPEQCATREVTGASDQYSLGVVAYELLTGRLPFRSDSTMAVMYAHFNERPAPVTDLRPDCPSNLAAAVMRMLEKEPLERWPSMEDVVAVCGRPSLRVDDPVRSQMSTLARAGGHAQMLADLKTPTSPIALAKPRARRRAPLDGRGARWGLALGTAIIAALLWWAAPWRTRPTPPAPVADTAVAPVVPRLPEPAAPVAREAPEAARRAPGPSQLPPPPGTVPSAAAAQRDDSLVRALREEALAAMRRALDAGATPADLATGTAAMHGAETLSAAGRTSEAIVQLATAASLWNDAERAARVRATRDTAPARAEPAAAPPAAVPPPADARPHVDRVIAEYARALESLDVGQVRRVYPGLTAAQQQGWTDFFRSVRRLRASFAVTGATVAGGRAEVTVSGVYEYENVTTGRTERRPAIFQATLVADGGGWRLTAIH